MKGGIKEERRKNKMILNEWITLTYTQCDDTC